MAAQERFRADKFLARLLGGEHPTVEDLDTIGREQVKEGLWLEFKHGDKIRDQNEGALMIREYVASFANSDGGVLLIGVDDGTAKVTGARSPGRAPLHTWANDAIKPIAPYLRPAARIGVVNHADGDVLYVAVPRAPALVPLPSHGRNQYWLRFGDTSFRADDYLISDLVMGHRQRPTIEVSATATWQNGTMTIDVHAHNNGLQWADSVRVGVVGYSFGDGADRQPLEPLKPYIDIIGQMSFRVRHCGCLKPIDSLPPFTSEKVYISPQFSVPLGSGPIVWRGAMYTLARNSPPEWWQLEVFVPPRKNNETIRLSPSLVRAVDERPEISIGES